MKLIYAAVFYGYSGEEGYAVEFPDLPGCVTQGMNLSEAMDMAVDAAAGWLLESIECGDTLPVPTPHSVISEQYNDASFVNYINIDIDEYAKQFGEKAVKKTLTIPRWLNTLAEKEGLNFSKILQNGLKKELKLDHTSVNLTTRTLFEFADIVVKQINSSFPRATAQTFSTNASFVTNQFSVQMNQSANIAKLS